MKMYEGENCKSALYPHRRMLIRVKNSALPKETYPKDSRVVVLENIEIYSKKGRWLLHIYHILYLCLSRNRGKFVHLC